MEQEYRVVLWLSTGSSSRLCIYRVKHLFNDDDLSIYMYLHICICICIYWLNEVSKENPTCTLLNSGCGEFLTGGLNPILNTQPFYIYLAVCGFASDSNFI